MDEPGRDEPRSTLRFFDCYCMVGRESARPSPHAARTGTDLTARMAEYGLSEALVHHMLIREDSPVRGNQATLAETDGCPNLHPAWGILPPQTGELGRVRDFITAMARAGVRALWAYPKKHRYILNAVTFKPLFEEMAQRRIPLFLEADWELLHRLLPEFPELRVVAVGHGCWGDDRYFRPLIERFPGFHIDTSRYELDGGIADFCRCYGSDRLLFGTGFPRYQIGGSILTLLHADIPTGGREAIAGGNLRRLLAEVDLT